MASKYYGSTVTIWTADMTNYEGELLEANDDQQFLVLKNAWKNGVRSSDLLTVVDAREIRSVSFTDNPTSNAMCETSFKTDAQNVSCVGNKVATRNSSEIGNNSKMIKNAEETVNNKKMHFTGTGIRIGDSSDTDTNNADDGHVGDDKEKTTGDKLDDFNLILWQSQRQPQSSISKNTNKAPADCFTWKQDTIACNKVKNRNRYTNYYSNMDDSLDYRGNVMVPRHLETARGEGGQYGSGFGSEYVDERGREYTNGPNNNSGGSGNRVAANNSWYNVAVKDILKTDFDFEQNLALFNKKEFCDSIRSNVETQLSKAKKNNYQVTEHILPRNPVEYRQVSVPDPGIVEYVTDEGIIIPSIDDKLKDELLQLAEHEDLGSDRMHEIMGRAACEMVLSLLGGNCRLNPHNTHQLPTVVALCGIHRQGALALNCVRQLECYGVRTCAYLTRSPAFADYVNRELWLYKKTLGKLITTVDEFPSSNDVDFVLMCLAENENTVVDVKIVKWLKKCKAPLMALDPPICGTPSVPVKYSLISVLPLSYGPQNGSVYLCNVNIPSSTYQKMGITYYPPFGSKSVIPLHQRNNSMPK